jgi:hypothetical protein
MPKTVPTWFCPQWKIAQGRTDENWFWFVGFLCRVTISHTGWALPAPLFHHERISLRELHLLLNVAHWKLCICVRFRAVVLGVERPYSNKALRVYAILDDALGQVIIRRVGCFQLWYKSHVIGFLLSKWEVYSYVDCLVSPTPALLIIDW